MTMIERAVYDPDGANISGYIVSFPHRGHAKFVADDGSVIATSQRKVIDVELPEWGG